MAAEHEMRALKRRLEEMEVRCCPCRLSCAFIVTFTCQRLPQSYSWVCMSLVLSWRIHNCARRHRAAAVVVRECQAGSTPGSLVPSPAVVLPPQRFTPSTAAHNSPCPWTFSPLQSSLAEAQAAQARTQEAYDHSQAALDSMKRKLQVQQGTTCVWGI